MTLDELLDAYLYATPAGPYTAGDATVRERAVVMLRALMTDLPDARAFVAATLAERHR